jgi:hypothetical protein
VLNVLAANASIQKSRKETEMKSKLAIGFVAVAVILVAMPLLAHHSFTAVYNTDKVVSIEGRLTQFMFRNPHSFVHVDVKEESGQVTRYSIEWAGAGQLSREGLSTATLRPGDHVIVTGNPGRNPADRRMRMKTITRPSDGLRWGGTFD